MKKFIKKLIFFANLLLVVITLITYISKFISPNVFWPISITGIFFPWVILFNVFFMVFWGIKKSRYFFLSFFVLIIGINSIMTFINFKYQKPHNKSAIRFCSYNLANIKTYRDLKTDAKKKSWKVNIKKFLSQNGPIELINLQEIQKYQTVLIGEILNLDNFFQHPTLGTAILTKYPIVDKGVVDIGKTSNSAIWADLKINKEQIIRVYSVHLQSNRITNTADQLAKKADLEDKETYRKIRNVFRSYKKSAQTREKQAALLLKHIKTSKYPTIVTGDFNDTPQSIVYSDLSKYLNDGFVERGFGVGTTFGGTIPLLRIDYIFAQEQFEFLDYDVFYGDYSDHYPVVSNILLK